MRGCCGAVAAPNYYQTAANTQGYSEGAQPYCQARGQALQCGEATGGPLCSALPSVHSHAMRPPLQPSAPAASSTSRAEIAGWQGNHVCKYDRTDKEMSWSLFSWPETLGREVCLFRSVHTMTAAELEAEAAKENRRRA